MDDLASAILAHVNHPNYQPVKPRVIAKKLGLPKDRWAEVRRAIKQLVKAGRVQYGPSHLVRSSKDDRSREILSGVFHRTAAGDGFVRPLGEVRVRGERTDVYIPRRAAGDAANGDLVRVKLSPRRGRGGRRMGEVIDILERETHQFVGVYEERAGEGVVRVAGRLFPDPIPVGDPGAKNAKPGDKVVMEMVRFPSPSTPGEGVVIEVLGPRGEPGVDTLSVIREFQLPDEFPEDVIEAARAQAEQFDETRIQGRADFTGLPAITIDPEDARDFDDAISLERLENGYWRLYVHIADVAHFVRSRSPLDREAKRRGTSVYLPDRVLPMLPELISNHLASLQPGKVRYARTAILHFAPNGVRTAVEVRRSAIRSRRRFTYDEVDAWLARRGRKKPHNLAPEIRELLDHMHQLAMLLRRRRIERGALELSLPEIRLELDERGRVRGARVETATESHQIIEEFMVAANEAVAELLQKRDAAFLRRIHPAPDPRKLKALTEFARELGLTCESLESRFEIQRLLEEAKGRPEQAALNLAVLRSMQKAVYSPEPEGHYALASDAYCHFTSPIRRYPDLTIHRALDALARGRRPPSDLDQLTLLGEHCSQREQRAEEAERELKKIKLLDYFSRRIGQTMRAVITGVEDFGVFAQGVELPAEGLIHVSTLQDDYYRYDPASHSLIGQRRGGRYRLGDLVEVEIQRVDLDRRELDLRIVRRLERPQAAGGAKAKRRGRRPAASAADEPSGKPGGAKAAGSAKKQRAGRSRTKSPKGAKAAKRKRKAGRT